MKYLLLAAVAVLATPALAQTTPAPEAQPMQEQTTPAPMAEPAAPATMAESPAPTPTPVTPSEGGYQPNNSMTPPPAGSTVRFVQPQTVEQAFPAPAPMETYPVCKKNQFDNCRQRGG